MVARLFINAYLDGAAAVAAALPARAAGDGGGLTDCPARQRMVVERNRERAQEVKEKREEDEKMCCRRGEKRTDAAKEAMVDKGDVVVGHGAVEKTVGDGLDIGLVIRRRV